MSEVLTTEDKVLGKVTKTVMNKGKSTPYLSSNHIWEVENKEKETGKSILSGAIVAQMLNVDLKNKVLKEGLKDIEYNGFTFKYLRKGKDA